VERWFAGLTQRQLRRGVHRTTRELENGVPQEVVVDAETRDRLEALGYIE
jgi:hypothetical protein